MNNAIVLLQSMTKREKFYFKKLYQDTKDKNYFRLYTYLEKHPNASISDLKKHFVNSSISKNIFTELNQLYKILLRTLHIYRINSSNSPYSTLMDLQYAQILMEKNMFEHCKKVLVKAKKEAYRREEYSVIIKIISLQEAVDYSSYEAHLASKLEALNKERNNCIELIENYMLLRKLRSLVTDIQFTDGLFIHDPQQFKDILLSPFFESESLARTKRALDHWYVAKAIAFLLMGAYSESIKLCKKSVRHIQSNPQLFSDFDLVKALNNLLFVSIIGQRYATFQKEYRRLETFKNSYTLSRSNLLFYKYYLGIRYYESIARPDEEILKRLVDDCSAFIFEKTTHLNSTQMNQLYFSVTLGWIKLRKFEEALIFLNEWNSSKVEKYTYGIRKAIQLVLFFELNYQKALKSELEAFSKGLKRLKIKSKTYDLLIRFLKSSLSTKKAISLQSFITALAVLAKDRTERTFFLEFNLLRWSKRHAESQKSK